MWNKLKANKHYQLAICIGLLLAISCLLNAILIPEKEKPKSNESNASVDTYIPKGFVLIPIEVINKESISGLIEGKGIVDLYDPKRVLVARQVRLIQAPLNDKVYAALVPDALALPILQQTHGLYVVIQSAKDLSQTKLVQNAPQTAKTKINYGESL